MNIYIGNLPHASTEEEVRAIFENHGQVTSVKIITDKFTGSSKGFAFVEMPNDAEAKASIEALNQTEVGGRRVRVNEAQPREARPPRSNGGGNRRF